MREESIRIGPGTRLPTTRLDKDWTREKGGTNDQVISMGRNIYRLRLTTGSCKSYLRSLFSVEIYVDGSKIQTKILVYSCG